MKTKINRVLFWTPRILCILFALFLSLFAMDVFGGNQGFWKTLLGLLIHLIPVFLIIIVLVLSWRWEWIGAVLFIVFAVLYLVMAWGRFHWSVYVTISGPLFIVGILFLFNWINKKQVRKK